MTADWTTCRVVRDCDGDLWGRDRDGWNLLTDSVSFVGSVAMMGGTYGPLIPVLDANGQPVVTTVGDLTLRQVRHRPQILLRVGGDVGTLYVAPSGEYALLVLNGQLMGRLQPVTLDTPCEVLA